MFLRGVQNRHCLDQKQTLVPASRRQQQACTRKKCDDGEDAIAAYKAAIAREVASEAEWWDARIKELQEKNEGRSSDAREGTRGMWEEELATTVAPRERPQKNAKKAGFWAPTLDHPHLDRPHRHTDHRPCGFQIRKSTEATFKFTKMCLSVVFSHCVSSLFVLVWAVDQGNSWGTSWRRTG